MAKICLNIFLLNRRIAQLAVFCWFAISPGNALQAQCPPNIDFEAGNFNGWKCYTGSIENITGNLSFNPSPPVFNRHAMLSAAKDEGLDYFGGFPKNCPNGSGYSIRLGNDSAGFGAEKISYTFTIPPDDNNFFLVYNYAIVLQDPYHLPEQQPRLGVEVLNVTDSILEPCASFNFVISRFLSGFKVSPHKKNDTEVRYKDWSAAFINLQFRAGKTYTISFFTTDCAVGGHFGYAYLDVNPGCSRNSNANLLGSNFCPDDQYVNLQGPPGFLSYAWFNSDNTLLGTDQNLEINPLPRTGDSVYVELTPYPGFGCVDTLKVFMKDSLVLKANAGKGETFCANPAVQLGITPKPREIYSWSPARGLSNANIANPVASPPETTTYTLSVKSQAGGCKVFDTVTLVKDCSVIEIFVPGAFTPNGDGVNDFLRPVTFGYSRLNYFRVYNRLGQLLYNTISDKPGWDGTIKGKPLGMQTVVWVLEAVDVYNRVERRQGTAVLIR